MSDIFELQDVSAFYGSKEVLHDISCKIKDRRITTIIGPSGCGKSTFLKMLNRLLEEEVDAKITGTILFNGRDSQMIPLEELRRHVGMVFQEPTPFPLSIYKNMTYAPLYYGVRKKADLDAVVRLYLERTGLWDEVKDELGKSALKLSGGQQQRLCIARSLTAKPDVLLLDEPCSALDVKSTEVIEKLLLELKEQYTIVMVTHNLFQARRLADDCLFLYNGILYEQNSAEAFFSDPQRKESKDYLQGVFS